MQPSKSREGRVSPSLSLAIFAAGCALLVAVHPDRFSGWALWALSPLFFYLAYLLAFRTPPQRARAVAAGATATGYAVVYGLAAGFGNEANTDLARLVYLWLPLLGLFAMLACLLITELAAAVIAVRSAPVTPEPRADEALPVGHGLVVAALIIAGWATFSVTGWTSPSIVVADARGKAPAAIAHVRCEGEDTYLLTPTVATLSNTVPIRVQNAGEDGIWLEWEIDGGSGGGGGEYVPPGASQLLITIRARTIGVVCRKHSDGTASDYATLAVVHRAQSP